MILKRCLAGLEERMIAPESAQWVQIPQDVGQSEDDAIAAYEAVNGPVGDAGMFIVQFV